MKKEYAIINFFNLFENIKILEKRRRGLFKGQKVKIRLKRVNSQQKVRVFVGVVLDMNNDWLKVEGKFYGLAKGESKPRTDSQARILGIPRENISIIRILPENLNLNNLKYTTEDNRMVIEVENHQPVSISE